ncbi:hypothetical protein UNH65_20575 [Chitinophaga sp. 180180018-2]|nr:hypothetical protein [Chitinophaga sp. 212800010-3]
MWSHLYWYYEIRGNEIYSQKLPTNDVLNVLENTGKLQRIDNQQFCNTENFPWKITVVHQNKIKQSLNVIFIV